MIDFDQARQEVMERLARSKQWIEANKNTIDFKDEDGYPTEEFLKLVRLWTFEMDQKELFDLIKQAWWMPEWGWDEGPEPHEWKDGEQVYCYHISTGGWSGNESIIHALKDNEFMMWFSSWVQSRRGGHYIFELKDWR